MSDTILLGVALLAVAVLLGGVVYFFRHRKQSYGERQRQRTRIVAKDEVRR